MLPDYFATVTWNQRSNQLSLLGSVFVGRFIVGVAVSVSAVADVSYLAEVAPKAFRGGMVSCNELAIALGMLAAFTAGHALRKMHGKQRWLSSCCARNCDITPRVPVRSF